MTQGLSAEEKAQVWMVVAAFDRYSSKVGLGLISRPRLEHSKVLRTVDPFDQVQGLQLTFYSGSAVSPGSSVDGQIQIRADGVVTGDYFVLAPHPKRPDAYVEAIDVWGRLDRIQGDLRIVAMSPEIKQIHVDSRMRS